MTVNERIDALRAEMKKRAIDFYLIPMSDFHGSEYVGDYFKGVEFISGFTGTNATVVISMEEAGLWTDGRYFIQAKRELKDTYVKLFEMGEEGVPTVEEYLEDKMIDGGCLGFDGRLFSKKACEKYASILDKKSGHFAVEEDLLDLFWSDRPSLPKKPIWILEDQYAGRSVEDKIAWLRGQMVEKGAKAHLLTSLYDIAWLLNLRGDDIACVPVFLSYVFLTEKEAILYVDAASLSDDVRAYLAEASIQVRDYNAIYEDLPCITVDSVLIDDEIVNYKMTHLLPSGVRLIVDANPTELEKSVKNAVEIENTKLAHIRDGVAVCKFIYYLKKNIGTLPMDELSASEVLLNFRKEQEHFLDVSFDTIAAYGPNAAMMHYEATPEKYSPLLEEGFLLVDSGGHYLEGTTDITRTIVLGPISDLMREYFTVTLRSNLRLAAAHFPEGATGQNLDVLARGPVWDMGLDYRCGTGHGVGHILNVHEGPNSFRWRMTDRMRVWPLKPGMITTDEPGLYIEDQFGIRHENELLTVEAEKTEYGQFYKFEPLTFVPFDLDAVDVSMLTYLEKQTLNEYHHAVYEKISPYLDEDEKAWLRDATRAI